MTVLQHITYNPGVLPFCKSATLTITASEPTLPPKVIRRTIYLKAENPLKADELLWIED